MSIPVRWRWALAVTFAVCTFVFANPFPPLWSNGSGPAVHYAPVAWPSDAAWKPYTRFNNPINDPRTQDPSNGGTAPQNYVNVSSSCTDKSAPSVYYYLHRGATAANDVIMFRWRVEQAAHNYATGPSPGNYSSSSPWSSAQWTVFFDINGSGYRSLAAHLNGSSGSPAEPIDMLVGIWSNTPSQSLDYSDSNVHVLGHNPTAFIGPGNRLENFHGTVSPDENWPNGASETQWDYGTTRATLVSSSPCTEYFIDYQIPVAMLDATSVGGPSITRDTPISMLFCTANSLTNPFQKDCAINRQWTGDAANPAPFGDYLSFNRTTPYQQPIISAVSATPPTSCPGSYSLSTTIQDTLAVQNGAIVPTVKSVKFYYWFDRDGDGQATASDTGSAWIEVPSAATRKPGTMNVWQASWSAGSLPKGKYLIGVQALDDNTIVDDGMAPTGVDNRTFSYLPGDSASEIFIGNAWKAGQQLAFPTHTPTQSPAAGENWYGNPSVTGMQVALVGTAINACGVAPTLTLNASPASVAGGGTVSYTVTVANPGSNSQAETVSSVSAALPTGFTYSNNSSAGAGGLPSSNPSVAGQILTWTPGAPVSLSPGSSATITFNATAGSTPGVYSATATAASSFGSIASSPATATVDSARLSLSMTPGAYSIAADNTTTLTYTLRYANDSGVGVTAASISSSLPTNVNYVGCSGGTACSNTAGTVSWTLGAIAANSSGTVTLTVKVSTAYTTFSLANSATLSATAPDSSTVTANASTTVAVTGVVVAGSPGFTLTKIASATTVAPGGSITYTLAYENYGSGGATGVVLTDTLPSGMTYSSCTGSCSQNSGTVTWSLGSVAAGATGSVTVTVTAGNPFTARNPATNNASLSWTGGGPVSASVSTGITGQACSTYYYRNATANVGNAGTQRIANISPVPVAGDTGSSVTVTAPVSGAAYLEALRFYQDPATTNDVPFDGNITSNIYIDRANGQGLNVRATVYDYNSSTGATAQLAQLNTLFNGSTKGLLTTTITPSGTLANGHRLLWVYEARSNHASQTVQVQFQFGGTETNAISGGTTFANSNAQYCVTPPANLTLTNRVSAASIVAGATPVLEYTLDYANAGSANATNTSLVASLPSGFTGCQYSTNHSAWAACSGVGSSPQSHTFTLGTSGTLAGGASGTVYVRGTVPGGTTAGDTLTGSATIDGDQTTPLAATTTTTVATPGSVASPALALSLSADRSTAAPGAAVVYTATVINTGNGTATNVVIGNTVPNSAYYTYGGCTGGCGVTGGNVLTWPTISSLAPGASQSMTYTMNVGTSGLPAGVTLINDDLAAAGDNSIGATSNTATVAVNGNPSLTLFNNVAPNTGVRPGTLLTYTLTLVNGGAANAASVVVTDPIPADTDYAGDLAATQGSGSFDSVNNQVRFDVGTLASGASTTLSFSARVRSPLSSGGTLISDTATATADNAAQQSATANVTANATATLALTKTAPASASYPSATLSGAAAGTVLLVDRTDRLQLGRLVQVGAQIARIVALTARTVTVDSPINAAGGTAINGEIPISVTYRNEGNAPATGVVVREALQNAFTYYSGSPTPDASPLSNGGNVDWNIGTVDPGVSATLEIRTFPNGLTGSFTNVATATAANTTTATANATTAIGGLAFAKSTTTGTVSAGSAASYSIVASNSLGTPVTGVTVIDHLPSGFSYKTGSGTVGGVTVEPTFEATDADSTQPIWGGLTIPAGGSLVIAFQADVAANTGAGVYQNELEIDAPAGVGVVPFDALQSSSEDVTVLAAASGIVEGYVFQRASGNSQSYDPAADSPLAGVRVQIHKSGADCAAPVNDNCYTLDTDANGYFSKVVAAESWIVSVVPATGALPGGWYQIAGTNDNAVAVPDQGHVTDYNGFSSAAPPSHTVSTSAGANGSIAPASRSVLDNQTTTFTITPDGGYLIGSVSGCAGSLSGSTYTTGLITADCTVTASFVSASLPTHTVSASAGTGGNVAPASAIVTDGGTTSFTVSADTGYQVNTVTGCAGSLTAGTYTTGAITADCAVSATFSPVMIAVSTSAGAHGAIAPAGANVAYGTDTSFTVTPDAGYDIASVAGCGGSLTGNTYTTGLVTSACTVTASFIAQSVPTFTVNAVAGSGGSISPASAVVASGATTSFTVTTDSGYHVGGAAGCGGGLSGTTYTTGVIGAACTVTVSFAPDTHVVSASAGTGGSISPPSQSVTHGATTTLSVTPDTGYSIASVSGCNGSLSGITYTTGVINAACSVTATFSQNHYLVTSGAGSGGAISPPSQSVTHGSTTTLTVTPDTGYSIGSVSGCGGSLTGNTFTTGAILAACSVSASFTLNDYAVTASAGAGGAISPALRTVAHGATTSFTLTPDSGYSVSGVSGCGGSLAGSTYTTGIITGVCAVTASFSNNNYAVTASAGSGGSVSPASQLVTHGNTTTVTVTPDTGYSIATVSGCAGSLSGNTFTTAAITGACAVTATFSNLNYAVTASAGSGGSISPASQFVTHGNTTTLQVTPDTGYSVDTVTGCGGSLNGLVYTTGTITAACAVIASFTLDHYTVTANAGAGGTITPPSRSVAHGATTTFQVTPDTGYSLSGVTGCNGSLSGTTYTTGAINAACAVTATFVPLAPWFDPAPPVSVNVRAVTIDVPPNIAPKAYDANGQPLTVTLVGESRRRPGRHVLTWRAVDGQGREITTTQQFDVWPMISAGNDVTTGFGAPVEFGLVLNGDAPQYPFTVAFTVTGPGLGTLHDLASGTATFTSGTEAWVSFNALPQGTSMPVQHLAVSLDPAANLGTRTALDIALVSQNEAPRATIVTTQDTRTGDLVAQDGGLVSLRVDIEDPNPRDTHATAWTVPAGFVVQTSEDGRTITFDPKRATAGLGKFDVRVTDSGTPGLMTTATRTLVIRAQAPVLGGGDANGNGISDADEGWGDAGNGIPAYLSREAPRQVLPEDAPVTDRYLVEGTPDQALRVGAYALLDGGHGARIDTATVYVMTATDVVTNVGGLFSVDATAVSATRGGALMVIPQRAPIPTDAVYRLWDPKTAKWTTFVEDGANQLASAPGSAGYCPPAGDPAYLPGLKPNDLCVQVLIQDGGPNDGDARKDGAMSSLGGVARKVESVVTGSSQGGGGGGAMGFEILLLALVAGWRVLRQRRALALVVLAVPLSASAADGDVERPWYGGMSLFSVRNSAGAADMDRRLAADGYTTSTTMRGQSRLGGSVFGGYSFDDRFAVELGYVSMGEMRTRIAGNTPVDDTYLRAISRAHPRSGEGPQASVLAMLPLGARFDVFGRAGLFWWRNTQTAETAGAGVRSGAHRFDPVLSFGVRYHLREKWTLRAAADLYRLDGEKLRTFGIGVIRTFADE